MLLAAVCERLKEKYTGIEYEDRPQNLPPEAIFIIIPLNNHD